MTYILMLFIGLVGGGLCVWLYIQGIRLKLKEQKRQQDKQVQRIQATLQGIKAKQLEFDQFAAKVVSYNELASENKILKRDLQNVDVNLRKLQLDTELQRQTQGTLDQRIKDLGSRYLKENVKWVGTSLTPNNFVACKQRLQKVIERCRAIDFSVPTDDESDLLASLKEDYEKIVRAAFEREEQIRIKAQIREERRLQTAIKSELEQLDREREAIKVALEKALAEAKDQHSEEVERLRARLAEAEAKSQRAISRAQITKAGYVYVITNIGSFGEDIFKVGMTRRDDPTIRVRELGSASVPFPFDVHMMISCDDAPKLENIIHRELHRLRINKANPRKEFFKTDIETIRQIVEKNHGEVEYVADPEALEYRQSLEMSAEDQEFIESVYDAIEDESETIVDEG
ncbi:MAG: GIY-YIG nuclease family protein [Phycisphaerae bacterium]|nr:GIY-YIG nuclease family protein [Phycisphaerae bacterium]